MTFNASFITNDKLKVEQVSKVEKMVKKTGSDADEVDKIVVGAGEIKEIYRSSFNGNFTEFLVSVNAGGTNRADNLEIYFEGAYDPSTSNPNNKQFSFLTQLCFRDSLDLGVVKQDASSEFRDNRRMVFMESYKPIIAGDVWRVLVKNTSASDLVLNRVAVLVR